MFRFFTTSIASVFRFRQEQGPARQPAGEQSQLLDGLPNMSARSQEFVRGSLAAWDSLEESERRVPTRF
jgi:hypothetical protein